MSQSVDEATYHLELMAGPPIEAYLYLLRRAFEAGEHSFVRNLQGVTEQHWDVILPGQPFGRTIGYIAWHTVAGKHLYWDHAFGEKKLTGDYTGLGVRSPRRTVDEVIRFGRKWHEAWLERVAAMTEADLEQPTTAHWGSVLSMRRVVAAMIEHDLYHAGEINHLRAQLDGTDKAPGD